MIIKVKIITLFPSKGLKKLMTPLTTIFHKTACLAYCFSSQAHISHFGLGWSTHSMLKCIFLLIIMCIWCQLLWLDLEWQVQLVFFHPNLIKRPWLSNLMKPHLWSFLQGPTKWVPKPILHLASRPLDVIHIPHLLPQS